MTYPASVPLLRRPWFWIAFAVVSALCAAISFRLFPKAFPVVSLDIRMDRAHAIAAARALATAQGWGPSGAVRDVASFSGLGDPQAFVELEGGGKDAFTQLLRDDVFSAYTWNVRLFRESETNQTVVRFKPDGTPYAFEETLRENAPGAALEPDAARAIAERTAAAAPWRVPLDRFKLVENSQVKRPGGRIDHTFVYERTDRTLGEGRLRLSLVVGGDRLTALAHFVKVPEAFSRKFEQMRSANNGIAGGASFAMILLYFVGGCGFGLAFLLRRRAVLWRAPLAWAAVIAGLQLLARLNAWPLVWLGYDTALSARGFFTEQLLTGLAVTIGMMAMFFLSFLAAEGLSREAFPHHPQLWRLWSREAAPTPATLGRTLGGFLFTSLSLLYVLAFYYVIARRLGWWTPSESLVDPNLLAHYQPWLAPLANSAQAGFWEESLFRAVPLAGAALLGSRLGGRRWWIAGAFVLQAVIFSAAHANYPGLPAWSRLVELLVPSAIFGACYLLFGLLPGIVLHFAFDVALMSLPLFAASGRGIWLDRALVVLLALVPLWIVLWRRWRAGAWTELPATLRNSAWQPPALLPAPAAAAPVPHGAPIVSDRLRHTALAAGLAGLLAWCFLVPHDRFGAPLSPGRTEAIAIARAELARRGVKLPASYRAFARVGFRYDVGDRFVWQTAGREVFSSLLGQYLPPVRWQVRFAKFEGDVAERAEEWNVYVAPDGAVQRFAHSIPEGRAGASLSETDARALAHSALRAHWRLDPAALKEVSATSAKRPKRLDWTFVFRDPAIKTLAPGEARLRIDIVGDEVADAGRFVFVPEDWERADRALQSSFKNGGIVRAVVLTLVVVAGLAFGIVAWSKKKFAVKPALLVTAVIFAGVAASSANRWSVIAINFSTAQPLALQTTMAIVAPAIGALVLAAAFGLVAGLVVPWLRAPIADLRRATVLGVSAGAALAGGLALAGLLRSGAGPAWPPLGAVEAFVPLLARALEAVPQFVTQTLTLLLIFGALDRATDGWRKRRLAAAAIAFLAATLLSLNEGGSNLAVWFAAAAASGLVTTTVFYFLLRRDLSLLPLANGVGGALAAVKVGLAQAYPAALAVAAVTVLAQLALGWWGTRLLRRLATPPA